MIIINFDMDGVLCDFNKVSPDKFDKKDFRDKVINEKIFENLELMPNIRTFQEEVFDFAQEEFDSDVFQVQILTSLGAAGDIELQLEVARQKNLWLDNNYTVPNRVMVEHKGLKKRFASPNSILIDDTKQNIFDFNECHGHGFLYHDEKLEENIKNFKELLRKVYDLTSVGIYRV